MTEAEPTIDAEQRVRAAYDTVAPDYAAAMRDELTGKPLDRALLAAVVEMAGTGTVADLGCGPGQISAYLAQLGAEVVGVDLSRSMIDLAREAYPGVRFETGSMTDLPHQDESFAAAVLMYSIIHLTAADRARAFEQLARVLRPGGVALVAFHIRSEEFEPGDTNRMTTWFGHSVDIEGYFLEPDDVMGELMRAGLDVVAITTRMPHPRVEFPSERAYLLVQRPDGSA